MNGLLLDTHALLWFAVLPERVPGRAMTQLRDRSVPAFVSSVTALELSLKHRRGNLPEAATLLASYFEALTRYGFAELLVSSRHALLAGALDIEHRDPFDRLLIAQAQVEGLTLVSADRVFHELGGLSVLWA